MTNENFAADNLRAVSVPAAVVDHDHLTAEQDAQRVTPTAALAALGIVYGDLGTSPLYTMQAVVGASGGHLAADGALGSLSLIFWALLISISVKYCLFVMRADNHGEGGILALMSMTSADWSKGRRILIVMGLFGAALIYGDGIITPAISVLSALEGLNVATDVFEPHVAAIAVVILVGLFAVQSRGTAAIGKAFGPVMLLWFAVIAALGVAGICRHPAVLAAVDPRYGIALLTEHGLAGIVVLGGIFLAMTGGEAMYADMGHIGRNPIRASWYVIVLPALLLSYAGQVGLFLDGPGMTGNPFFRLAPSWSIYPLVALATVATIIASQAIITGSFSLTRQAIQLGWFPGVRIRQTSSEEYGQIYVPFVNWTMLALTVTLTIGFGSSDRLAGAYGTAVSTTMLLTTALLYNVMREHWRWPLGPVLITSGLFLTVDFAFFTANLFKIWGGRLDPAYVRHAGISRHGDMAFWAPSHARPSHDFGRNARGIRLSARRTSYPACPRDRRLPHAFRQCDAISHRRARRADAITVRNSDCANRAIRKYTARRPSPARRAGEPCGRTVAYHCALRFRGSAGYSCRLAFGERSRVPGRTPGRDLLRGSRHPDLFEKSKLVATPQPAPFRGDVSQLGALGGSVQYSSGRLCRDRAANRNLTARRVSLRASERGLWNGQYCDALSS